MWFTQRTPVCENTLPTGQDCSSSTTQHWHLVATNGTTASRDNLRTVSLLNSKLWQGTQYRESFFPLHCQPCVGQVFHSPQILPLAGNIWNCRSTVVVSVCVWVGSLFHKSIYAHFLLEEDNRGSEETPECLQGPQLHCTFCVTLQLTRCVVICLCVTSIYCISVFIFLKWTCKEHIWIKM